MGSLEKRKYHDIVNLENNRAFIGRNQRDIALV